MEADKNEVKKVLKHLGVDCKMKETRQLVKAKEGYTPPALVSVKNMWTKSLILASQSKMQSHEKHLFFNADLSTDELKLENLHCLIAAV